MAWMGTKQAIDEFEKQFEQGAAQFVYRRNGKGAAYPLTEGEKNDLVAGYRRFFRLQVIGWAAVALAMIVAIAFFGSEQQNDAAGYVIVAIVIGGMLATNHHAWRAPERLLSRRVPVAPARTRDEVRERLLTDLTWTKLAGVAALMAVVAASFWSRGGWGEPIAIAIAAGMALLLLVRVVQKLRR